MAAIDSTTFNPSTHVYSIPILNEVEVDAEGDVETAVDLVNTVFGNPADPDTTPGRRCGPAPS